MSRLSGLGLPPSLMRLGAGQIGRHVLNPDLPWPTQRQRLDRLMGASPIPRGTHVTELTINGVRTETVTVIGDRPKRTVLHFHGGGYCVGSAKMAQGWAARLAAQAACQVVVPEYRLAPEHPFPAALDDARNLLRALPGDVDPASVVLSGDSAGAGLAMSLLLALREAGEELPAGAILISPWLDLTADRQANSDLVRRDVLLSPGWLKACASAYTSPSNWPDPAVSPLLGQPDGLPPLLIQSSSDDLLAPDAQRLAVSASAAKVDVTYTTWPRMWHDFALQPGLLAAANSALAQAAWFVGKVTSPG
ncbi:MAG TPA: alpha/beta hydrolase [Streptosporangiaceae bacterium]|jgi:acetyl esterase/lipase